MAPQFRCFLLLFSLPALQLAFLQEPVQQSTTSGRCSESEFQGEVIAGREFRKEFGAGLLFRLVPEGDPVTPGWTIQIHEKSDTKFERDFLMVATPPYRLWNPRYLNRSYGHSAKDAVSIRERRFGYVLTRAQYAEFDNAMRTVLWSYGHTKEEHDAALATVLKEPRCSGRLHILDSKVEATEDGRGRIARLKFEVKLTEAGPPQ